MSPLQLGDCLRPSREALFRAAAVCASRPLVIVINSKYLLRARHWRARQIICCLFGQHSRADALSPIDCWVLAGCLNLVVLVSQCKPVVCEQPNTRQAGSRFPFESAQSTFARAFVPRAVASFVYFAYFYVYFWSRSRQIGRAHV